MDLNIAHIESFPNGLAINWNDKRDSFIDFKTPFMMSTNSQVSSTKVPFQSQMICLYFIQKDPYHAIFQMYKYHHYAYPPK